MASLTFIRREIFALEALGHEVLRFALQPWADQLVDQLDIAEAQRTRYVKSVGLLGLALRLMKYALVRPRCFLVTFRLTWKVASLSDRSLGRHIAYFAEACVLADWLKKEGVEHVHAHFATNSAEVAMLAHQLGGPGYSFTVHGPEDFDRAACLSLDEKVARAKFVATISSYARSQIYRWVDVGDWDKVAIVRCGVDAELLDEPIVPLQSGVRLVNVGRLCEQKGQMLLLAAAAKVVESGHSFELVLIGDGEMRSTLEQSISTYGLEKTVRLLGWATNEEVRNVIRDSRALILASFAEGLPVVIMESLALGRPVVSTWVAGVPELVEDGENGWLVIPGDVEALAEAMIATITTSVERINEMGIRGRKAAAERHDIRHEARRLSELIQGRNYS